MGQALRERGFRHIDGTDLSLGEMTRRLRLKRDPRTSLKWLRGMRADLTQHDQEPEPPRAPVALALSSRNCSETAARR
jgi:hypothetical protein